MLSAKPAPERHRVEARDGRAMSLWLADLGVNWLLAKEQRKADRQQTQRREKQVRKTIDGPVRRREAKDRREEDAVSEAAKAEALERAGVGG